MQARRDLRERVLFLEVPACEVGVGFLGAVNDYLFECCGTEFEGDVDELVGAFVGVVADYVGVEIGCAEVIYFLFCEVKVFDLHAFDGDADAFPGPFVDERALTSTACTD